MSENSHDMHSEMQNAEREIREILNSSPGQAMMPGAITHGQPFNGVHGYPLLLPAGKPSRIPSAGAPDPYPTIRGHLPNSEIAELCFAPPSVALPNPRRTG